jgi:hypothetical protein
MAAMTSRANKEFDKISPGYPFPSISIILYYCFFFINHSNDTGQWTNDGLTQITKNKKQTVCSTSHLTSFVVLMQFSNYQVSTTSANKELCSLN